MFHKKIRLRLNNAHFFFWKPGLEINFHKVYHPSADKTVNFLVLLPWNVLRIQNNFNRFSMIDVHQNATLSESFEGDRSRVIDNRCNISEPVKTRQTAEPREFPRDSS